MWALDQNVPSKPQWLRGSCISEVLRGRRRCKHRRSLARSKGEDRHLAQGAGDSSRLQHMWGEPLDAGGPPRVAQHPAAWRPLLWRALLSPSYADLQQLCAYRIFQRGCHGCRDRASKTGRAIKGIFPVDKKPTEATVNVTTEGGLGSVPIRTTRPEEILMHHVSDGDLNELAHSRTSRIETCSGHGRSGRRRIYSGDGGFL